MTNQQKNQLIADKCPGVFKNIKVAFVTSSGWYFFSKTANEWCRCVNGSIIDDLNAMAVAEATLNPEQLGLFAMWWVGLVETFHRLPSGYYPIEHYIWHATSHQRAEAFLRTIGKWEK